jgi:hypothetical protein
VTVTSARLRLVDIDITAGATPALWRREAIRKRQTSIQSASPMV